MMRLVTELVKYVADDPDEVGWQLLVAVSLKDLTSSGGGKTYS